MRKEIDLNLDLSVSKEALLDYHSLLNLLNVLQFELNALLELIDVPVLAKHREFVVDLLITLADRKLEANRENIQQKFTQLANDLRGFSEKNPKFKDRADIISDIIEIAFMRLEELKKNRFNWEMITVSDIKFQLTSFLKVMEKVSRERYHFVYPPKKPDNNDYLIAVDIGESSETIFAPLIISDVIRDLVANSRKYSDPGSTIHIQISHIDQGGIELKVTDEGMGIPENEIMDVVKFQQRATNVKEIQTMGKGYGLTKAYHICKIFHGKFVIQSELKQGTTIELTMYPTRQDSIASKPDKII